MQKGQASSIYVFLGVLLVAIFGLLTFVTQSGSQAENLETMITSDVAFDSQLRLRRFYTQSYQVVRADNMKVMTAISYSCLYGNKKNNYATTISKPKPVTVAPQKFLRNYLNSTLGEGYRLEIECGEEANRTIIVGKRIPENQTKVVSSEIEFPLPESNRSTARLLRW
ncbi:MAG: hypothetical protein ABEJ93_03070 [Candidatus Nanohalobium sp.]